MDNLIDIDELEDFGDTYREEFEDQSDDDMEDSAFNKQEILKQPNKNNEVPRLNMGGVPAKMGMPPMNKLNMAKA